MLWSSRKIIMMPNHHGPLSPPVVGMQAPCLSQYPDCANIRSMLSPDRATDVAIYINRAYRIHHQTAPLFLSGHVAVSAPLLSGKAVTCRPWFGFPSVSRSFSIGPNHRHRHRPPSAAAAAAVICPRPSGGRRRTWPRIDRGRRPRPC